MLRWSPSLLLVAVALAVGLGVGGPAGVSSAGAADTGSLSLAASVPTASAPAVTLPAVTSPAVILEARVSSLEPGIEPGDPWVLAIEVDEVVAGSVPGGSLLVRLPSDRRLPVERFLQPGRRFRLELRRREDGAFELRSGYRLPDREAVPLPGGVIATPGQISSRGSAAREEAAREEAAYEEELSSAQAAVSATPTFEERVVELVNQERLANGNLPPLKHDALLDGSSELHSSNMATRDFFAHCDPDTGTLPWDRMDDAGYFWSFAGENIAAGYSTPQDAMVGWMGSAGHRANILSTGFREIGVGYVLQSNDAVGVRFDQDGNCNPDGSGGPFFRYWTQNFGSRFNVYPVVIEREAHDTDQQTVDLYVYGAGWAQEMRFSNDHSTWSSWQPFSSTRQWSLGSGNGLKTVWAQLRNGGTVREASDTILFSGACTAGQDQVELTNQTLGGTQTFEACIEVMAHNGVHVSGDATFRAGERIVLGDGFSVGSGASFQAVIQVP